MKITRTQNKIVSDPTRFKIICAGRRWGKTYLALHWLIRKGFDFPNSNLWFISPTYRQSKNIAWQILKNILYDLQENVILKKNESSLEIELINGSIISLKGADSPDSLRGTKLHSAVLDEFAYMKKDVWESVIRPSLADTKGEAMFIGTPDGYNYFYELYCTQNPDFKSYHFKTIDSPFVDKEEIEKARVELDEKTFRQEYEASFETATGRVYYAFDRVLNIKEKEFDSQRDIILCTDFNVEPMKWAIIQNYGQEDYVIDEVVKYDTHTKEMAEEVIKRYPNSRIFVYGDSTAEARSTRGRSTDYDIIKEAIPNSDTRLRTNPLIVDRVNAVNARLCNAKGQQRLYIDPKCKHAIKDFEQVVWEDKARKESQADRDLTHISSAIGYYCEYEYSLKGKPTVEWGGITYTRK